MRTRNIAIPAENKVPTKLGVCQSVSFCNHSAPGALPHGSSRNLCPVQRSSTANTATSSQPKPLRNTSIKTMQTRIFP